MAGRLKLLVKGGILCSAAAWAAQRTSEPILDKTKQADVLNPKVNIPSKEADRPPHLNPMDDDVSKLKFFHVGYFVYVAFLFSSQETWMEKFCNGTRIGTGL